jgi:hypothetical protein
MLPYEKKYFSQNGEDGIFEFLLPYVDSAKNFLEIGWGNGTENCCRNLIENHSFTGTGVDMRQSVFTHRNFKSIIKKVTLDDINFLLSLERLEPCVFTLDIDSIDWHIMFGLIKSNFRPKIICHEYNSTLGPNRLLIRSEKPGTRYDKKTLYGASLRAYAHILNPYYNFITVDSRGVNAFWLRKDFNITQSYQKHDFLFLGDYGVDHENNLIKILSTDNSWYEILDQGI